ncbi:hypothetical protein [Streptomyces calidiresistens]|uniref:hypothetical protein n=1 Tax=Streptomyces calidiresistens TaxID=1485586 RepID=UPI002B21ECB6|nr:hypothetical protein [Streptomyces calidiresistens]
MGLLLALAGGAGGELGRQSWNGLAALVRRPFRRGDQPPEVGERAEVAPAEPELVALEEAPADEERGRALSAALAYRAAVDVDFRAGLEEWVSRAREVRVAGVEVKNTISGGSFHGPVIQGNNFSGLTWTTSPLPPPANPEDRGA